MIHIISNGFDTNKNGEVNYAWYELYEKGEHFYRAVILKELKVLSWNRDEKEETLLGRQTAGITGLYWSKCNMLYAACGVYDPWMGIIQMYGAAENGHTKEDAVYRASVQMASVESMLRAFPQTKMALPNIQILKWYSEFISSSNNVLALLGYPDPRTKNRVGAPQNGEMPDESANDLAAEQLEIFFRGMASLNQSFIYQVAADRMDHDKLVRTNNIINNITSD